jgi:hypothetical protein
LSKLGDFLKEVSNWDWEAFCRAEHDTSYTSNEAMIFALVRACAMEKMDAIKLALNRIDGKLKTPIKIEYPKIFFLFPNALAEGPLEDAPAPQLKGGEFKSVEVVTTLQKVEPDEEESDLPSLSLRQTVTKMSDAPRQVPEFVITYATQTQQWLNGQAEEPPEKPMVKSVVAAHLLKLAQNRNTDALAEVFDQIDGKLVETIQILGEDLYITSYSTVAPKGAYLNDDGVLQLEATMAQDIWAQKLGTSSGS